MLRITVTAKNNPVTIQDPRPVTQSNLEQGVFHIEPGTPKIMDLTWGQVERIRTQLDALTALGFVTFTVEGSPVSAFARQADSLNNPAIDYADDSAMAPAGQALTLTGTNLLAGQTRASAAIAGDTVAGHVDLFLTNPGAQGNFYDVKVVDTGGSGGLTVAIATVLGREVITIDLGGSAAETVTKIVTKINTAGQPTYGIVQAVAVGTGSTPITTVRALTAFTGGVGSGMSVTLAGIACTVVAVNIAGDPIHVLTLATPSLAGLSLSTGAPLVLELRSNGKCTSMTLTQSA